MASVIFQEGIEMMELEDFIKKSLVQIVSAVKTAQSEVEGSGGAINPTGLQFWPKQLTGEKFNSDGNITQNVHFDVAVTAIEGKGTKGGIGVFVGAVGLGSQGESNVSTQAASRIKFTVPVLLPGHKQ